MAEIMNPITQPETVKKAASSMFADSASRSTGSELDKNAFLTLLVAQLKYQDPLDTASNTEFVSQLAQFSTLEQMQQMTASFSEMQAQNMIGKFVSGTTMVYDDFTKTWQSSEFSGIVSGTYYNNGTTYLVVNDPTGEKFVTIDQVEIVLNADYDYGWDQGIINSANLIDKNIWATIPVLNDKGEVTYDDDKNVITRDVIGTVTAVTFKNGRYIALVEVDGEEVEVDIGNINKISDTEIAPDYLKGKYISWMDGTTKMYGKVSEVAKDEHGVYWAKVGDVHVKVADILQVSNKDLTPKEED